MYTSHSLVDAGSPEILAIAETSLHRNGKCGVTGYLYFDNEVFLQVLEGLLPDIEMIYASILRDSRHEGVRTLLRQPIETRAFGEWAMGYYDGTIDGGLIGQVFGPDLPTRATEKMAPQLLRFLRDLSLGRADVYRLPPEAVG